MAFEVDLEELMKEENADTNKILSEYFSKKNIALKTEINAPFEFTLLETHTKHFNDLINFNVQIGKRGKRIYKHEFKQVPKQLQDIIDFFKVNMVTYGRKSRIEVGEIIKAMKQQESGERSILQKLTGFGKEK